MVYPVARARFGLMATGDELTSTSALMVQGGWSSSFVMVRQYRLQRPQFTELVEKSLPLSHPNVVEVFGASHLRSAFIAVFKNASSTHLQEYLARGENKPLLLQKLFEVALGLKYLIERGVFVKNLRCDDVWVGTDGLARICALDCMIKEIYIYTRSPMASA